MSDHNQSYTTANSAVLSGEPTACRAPWPEGKYIYNENNAVILDNQGAIGPYSPSTADQNATDWIVDYGGDKPPMR